MAYTALYRKWRSHSFDDIAGQDPIVQSFKNQVRLENLAHAYLFSGTRGTGKTSIAKILARAVNCTDIKDGNPCNKCDNCTSILNESNMDVIELDAASNNGVDNIRKIADEIKYPPSGTMKFKVFIIDEVHMLSKPAQNTFLKTLEEPPSYVIFILATTEPHKLLPTILSRCQKYSFKRISVDIIKERLKEIARCESIDISDEALYYIARMGDGSMRDAISLLDQCSMLEFQKRIEYEDALSLLGVLDVSVFSKLSKALGKRDIEGILNIVAYIVEDGRDLKQFVDDFILYIRNMIVAKSVDDIREFVDFSYNDILELEENSRIFSIEEMMRFIRILSDASSRIAVSFQKRVLIETVLMKMAYPEEDPSKESKNLSIMMSSIERRIDELSKRSINIEDISKLSKEISKKDSNIKAEAETETELEDEDSVDSMEEKEIPLPKSQYENYISLDKNWKKFAFKIDNICMRNAMLKSYLKPSENGSAINVITNSDGYNCILNEKKNLEVLEKLIYDNIGRSIDIKIVFSDEARKNNIVYVTDEELKSKINMEIEIENIEEDF